MMERGARWLAAKMSGRAVKPGRQQRPTAVDPKTTRPKVFIHFISALANISSVRYQRHVEKYTLKD